MNIFTFSDDNQMKQMYNGVKSLMSSKLLVPFLGAGFSAGTTTKRGTVPTAADLKTFLINEISQFEKFSQEKKDALSNLSLSDVSYKFFSIYEKSPRVADKFSQYINDNFTNAFGLDQSNKKFLNSGWQYIFTLNYDDSIETSFDVKPIFPYDRQNPWCEKDSKCMLYKLHGDAKRFINTGDNKFLILSKSQYLRSLKDYQNMDMLTKLQSNFLSKSLIFIGCGLSEELDLLFAAETGFAEKALTNPERKMLYVYFTEEFNELTIDMEIKLEQYGITDVILIKNRVEMSEFYKKINSINLSIEKEIKTDSLSIYTNPVFEYLTDRDERNYSFLLMDDFFQNKTTNIITLPSFFIRRVMINQLISDLNSENSIIVLTGTRMSGKTYCIFGMLERLHLKKTYYFPTGTLLDEIIEDILQKEDCILIFDEGSIGTNKIYDLILSQIDVFKMRRTKIVLVSNVSNEYLYRSLSSRDELQNKIVVRKLRPYFEANEEYNEDEINNFNRNIATLSLPNYNGKNTILDYLYIVEQNQIKKRNRLLPRTNIFDEKNFDEIKALIILANEKVISSEIAIMYGIDNALYKLINTCSITIHKDYLTSLENRYSHSGFKFALNSLVWAIACLSELANDLSNHLQIANIYCDIVRRIKNSSKTSYEFRNSIRNYIFFDDIQILFSKRNDRGQRIGSISLLNTIYDQLHPILADEYQFLHQEAICKLRMSRREKNAETKKEYLEKANRNITRAISLASDDKYMRKNIEYTLAHMYVTKSLILSKYFQIDNDGETFNKAILSFHEAFVTYSPFLDDDLKKEEMEDVKEFVNQIVINSDMIIYESKVISEEILSRLSDKKFSFA